MNRSYGMPHHPDAACGSLRFGAPTGDPHGILESPYLSHGVSLSEDAPIAHGISIMIEGSLTEEAVRGRLFTDPNVCELNDFGDRINCTNITVESHSVALTRLHSNDPARLGRTLFAVTGAGLPDGLTLIVYCGKSHGLLKHDKVLVPLYLKDQSF